MRVVKSFLNQSEEVVFRELQRITKDNDLLAFAKPRLSDVIEKGDTRLTQREFDYFIRCHCDFVITDKEFRPKLIVEYDGPFHSDAKQVERDKIKNELCQRAELGLLRINDKHVTRLYRGMTVLRWIVEVTELQIWFDKAQQDGQIPIDEPFDPAIIGGMGDRKWHYWLSVNTTQRFHAFFDTLPKELPKGWNSLFGSDNDGTDHCLSCLHFGDQVIYTKTAIRNQQFAFPHHDLLNELSICELGIQFEQFRTGKARSTKRSEFKSVFKGFCERYNAHPSFSLGSYPVDGRWNFNNGWNFN